MEQCKCKGIKEYWDAVGNTTSGYYTRRDLIEFLAIGAIPIIGQLCLLFSLIKTFFAAREDNKILRRYKLSYLEKIK